MLESFTAKIEKPDPMTYSIRPPERIVSSKVVKDLDKYRKAERLQGLGEVVGDVYELLGSDGNSYYEISEDRRHAPRQLFYSRLLKGILHIADIVPFTEGTTTRYLSRKMPLKDIRTPLTTREIQTEIEIMYLIFWDNDHDLKKLRNINVQRAWLENPFKRRMMLFDLDQGGSIDSVRMPQEVRLVAKTADKEYMHSKLSELRARVSGTEGIAFVKAIEKSIPGFNESTRWQKTQTTSTEYFCERLIQRLDLAIYALTSKPTKKEKQEWKAYLDHMRSRM